MRFRQKASLYLAVSLTLFNVAVGIWHPKVAQAGSSKYVTVSGKVIDAATIKIDAIVVNDAGFKNILGDGVKSNGIKDVADLNAVLNSSDAIGTYKNESIENAFDNPNPTRPEGFQYKRDTCGGNKSQIKITNNGGLEFKLVDVYINIGSAVCVGVFNNTGDGDITMTDGLEDRYKMMVWFNWTSANTIVRVDGKDGQYVQTDKNNPKAFLSNSTAELGHGGACLNTVVVDGQTSSSPNFGRVSAHAGYDIGVFERRCSQPKDSPMMLIGDTDKKKLSSSDTGAGTQTGGSCESNNNTIIIGYLVCAGLNLMDNMVESAGRIVNSMLEVKSGEFNSGVTGQNLKSVWSLFRAISSFALVAVALVMIIGQAMGGGS